MAHTVVQSQARAVRTCNRAALTYFYRANMTAQQFAGLGGTQAEDDDMEWIGHRKKFDHVGNVQPYPGNTVICHLNPDSNLFRGLAAFRTDVDKQSFASAFVFLPPSSWHMTIFEGVSDRVRKPGVWPKDLPFDAPLEQCTDLFEERLRKFRSALNLPIRMKVTGFEPLKPGIALQVRPIDAAQEQAMRQYRDKISKLLDVRFPQHDTYSFHVSISYSLRRFTKEEHDEIRRYLEAYVDHLPAEFELGVPEYCTFEDMFAFPRVFKLLCSDDGASK